MSTYGLDLRDALWGESPYGARRLNALLMGLPPDAAVWRSVDPDATWTQEDELLATIHDQIAVSNHMFIRANTKKGTHVPDVVRFPRPYERERERRAPSPKEEVLDFFMDRTFSQGPIWDAHAAEENLNGD